MGSVLRQERKRITVKQWDDEFMLFFAHCNKGQFILPQTPTNRGGIWTVDNNYRAFIERQGDELCFVTCYANGSNRRNDIPFKTFRGTLRECIDEAVMQLDKRVRADAWSQIDRDNAAKERQRIRDQQANYRQRKAEGLLAK